MIFRLHQHALPRTQRNRAWQTKVIHRYAACSSKEFGALSRGAQCWSYERSHVGINSVVKCPPLNWKLGCSIHGHWVNFRSTPWARMFTQNRPGRGQISGFGLPLTAVTKNLKKRSHFGRSVQYAVAHFCDDCNSLRTRSHAAFIQIHFLRMAGNHLARQYFHFDF